MMASGRSSTKDTIEGIVLFTDENAMILVTVPNCVEATAREWQYVAQDGPYTCSLTKRQLGTRELGKIKQNALLLCSNC